MNNDLRYKNVTKENKKTIENELKKLLDIDSAIDLDTFGIVGEDIEKIPTGIAKLDPVLDGGYPKGKLIELYGKETSGKSTMLFMLYADATRRGLKCLHIDVECSYNPVWARSNGVITDNLTVVSGVLLPSAEKVFEYIHFLCNNKMYDIIGLDSIASLAPDLEEKADISKQNMAGLARAISKAMKKIIRSAEASGTTVIYINQIREKVGQLYGDPEDTPGGRALKHAASLRIKATMPSFDQKARPDLFGADGRKQGHVVRCDIKKSRFSMPNKICEFDLRYQPLDAMSKILEDALESGVLEKSKSNGKKITYKGNATMLPEKGDYNHLLTFLVESELIFDFLDDCKIPASKIASLVEDGYVPNDLYDEWIESGASKKLDISLEEEDNDSEGEEPVESKETKETKKRGRPPKVESKQ